MRSFVLEGPFSLNGYAEVPENAPTDYRDEVYDDLDVWGGLTFSGYGIVRSGELISIYDNELVWKDDESETSKESIKTKSDEYADGDEIVKIVGFDDSHRDSCPRPIKYEAKRLARQIDELFINELAEMSDEKKLNKLKRDKTFWRKVSSVLLTRTGIIDKEYVDKQLYEIESKIKDV